MESYHDADRVLICRLGPAKYIDPDVRNYFKHRLLGAGVRGTIYHLYPRLLAVHDLDDSIALPHLETRFIEMPSLMRDSHIFMQGNGIYLIGRCYLCSTCSSLPTRFVLVLQTTRRCRCYGWARAHLRSSFSICLE